MPRSPTTRFWLLWAAWVATLSSPLLASADIRQVVLSSQTATVRVQRLAGTSGSAAVLIASGADGWRGLTSAVADRLVAGGYAVVGLDVRSYLVEATRRSGAVTPAAVADDYLALLRDVHDWFPGVEQVFLLGVAEGGGLALVAAADTRVGAQLTGVVGVDTPATLSMRSAYWHWTSWITHRDTDDVSVAAADYLPAIAPVPVSFIYGTEAPAVPIETAQESFDGGGEPRRLAVIETERGRFEDVREQLFDTLRDCLGWSTRVRWASSARVMVARVPAARSLR